MEGIFKVSLKSANGALPQPVCVCVCVTSYSRLQVFERMSEDDVEDSVRSTALLIHVGSSDSPRLIPL